MGNWIKRHKALFIVLCVLTVVIGSIVAFVAYSYKVSKQMLQMMTTNETSVVERRDLVEAISANGVVVCSDSRMVTARVSGVDVNDVLVSVGDYVNEGDLICVLDSTKLEETLEIAQLNLDANEESLARAVAAAQRAYNDAVNSQNQANAAAQTSVADAERSLALARDSYNAAQVSYNNACNDANPIIDNLNKIMKINDLNKRIAEINTEIEKINTELSDLEIEYAGVIEGDDRYAEYQGKKSEKEGKIATLVTELNSKIDELGKAGDKNEFIGVIISRAPQYATTSWDDNGALGSAKASIEERINASRMQMSNSENQVKMAEEAYNRAKDNAATPSGSSTVSAARDSLNAAQTNAEIGTLSAEQQIAAYLDQIEDCLVYAPISGIVTSVNFIAGDLYAGSPIVTIENTNVYNVETYISEYDIGMIAVGQEVVVKTNGTGDTEIEGVVKSIAPRATPGANGVSYKVVVELIDENASLRLDMTAKLSIIISKAANVVTVPYESVITDDDGKTYVEISKGTNPATGLPDKEKIYVTTGTESAYYVEITSGNISEGMEVIVPRSAYEGFDIMKLLEDEGALGGY